jgi:hypothetical protein
VPQEAPDVRETPTDGRLFPVGEEILSAAGKMVGQTCNNTPESPLTIALRSAPCVASSYSCVVGSISTTLNCHRLNPHRAIKNKDRNFARISLREFIPNADERLHDYLE